MLKDDSLFPFGKHIGTKMANVPDGYLLWLKTEIEHSAPNKRTTSQALVLEYIKENLEILNKENGK